MSAADAEDNCCFVGGISFSLSDRELEDIFRPFARVTNAKVILDRDTGRSRGFGFVTFVDAKSMHEAIDRWHGKELDGRLISVTKAIPRHVPGGDRGYESYPSLRGKSYSGGTECFKCGRLGHWARDCPSGGGGKFSSRDQYSGNRGVDRFSNRDYDKGRNIRDYDRGRHVEVGKDRFDRYNDRYLNEDKYIGGRTDGYRDRGYDRDGGHSNRYSGDGPLRYRGNNGDRAGPYDRPMAGRGGRSSYDRN